MVTSILDLHCPFNASECHQEEPSGRSIPHPRHVLCAPRGSRETLRASIWYFRRIPQESRVSLLCRKAGALGQATHGPSFRTITPKPGAFWILVDRLEATAMRSITLSACKQTTNISLKRSQPQYAYFILIEILWHFRLRETKSLYSSRY